MGERFRDGWCVLENKLGPFFVTEIQYLIDWVSENGE